MKNTFLAKVSFCLATFLCAVSCLQAQNGGVANNWYFGYGAGVSFNTLVPTSITSAGPINTLEGVATISDAAGNLLFSTDGIQVFNSNNLQMPNGFGLWGDPSSTQSGVIVPNPANASQYYLFTVAAVAGANGIAYSVVDMSLNGGLGDVTTIKNVQLLTPAAEKITAVRHCNGTSYWIICHHWGTDAFYSYLVSASGIAAPIISNAGSIYNGSTNATIGYLKASPDGQRLAAAIDWVPNNNVELFDFDNSTGIISNAIYIPTGGGGYGVAFSPDNTKLYIGFESAAELIQYDLTASNIGNTAYTVHSAFSSYGAAQLGPDGKIYATYNSGYLGIVNNPNVAGVGCNYDPIGVPLTAGTGAFGLPNFPDNLLSAAFGIPDVVMCGNSVVLDAGAGYANYLWSTGDTVSAITVTQAGQYWIQATTNCGNILIDTINVYSNLTPFDIGNDTIVCSGANVVIDGQGGGSAYLWSNGATTQTITVSTPGLYWVQKVIPCGTVQDTLNVFQYPVLSGSISYTTIACVGATITVAASGGAGSLQYSLNGGTYQNADTFSVSTGTYSVTIQDTAGCTLTTNTLNIVFPSALTASAIAPAIICHDDTTTLTVTANNGTLPYQYTVNSGTYQAGNTFGVYAGNYVVTVQDGAGCMLTLPNISFSNPPALLLDLGNDISVCTGVSINIDAQTGGTSYLWSNGATTQAINITTPGTIWVQKGTICGTLTDSMHFYNYPIISGNLSANLLCMEAVLTVAATGGAGNLQYSLNGGLFQNSPIFTVASGTYTVTIKDTAGCSFTTNTLNITFPPALSATTTFSPILCHDGTTTLSINITGGQTPYQYALNSGTWGASNTFTLNSGNYGFRVLDANGCIFTLPIAHLFNPAQLFVSATVGTLCYHSTTILKATGSGGTGIKQYSLDGSPYQVSRNFTISTGGTYTLTVQDSNNCTATTMLNVIESLPIAIQTLFVDSAYCDKANGIAAVFASGGNEGFTYTWLNSPRQYNDTLLNAAEGTYYLQVRDSKGCQKDTSSFMPNVPSPVANYISRPDNNFLYIYENDSIQFFPNTAGVYSYSWNFGDGNVSTLQNPTHIFPKFGEYEVELTIYDEHQECPDTYGLRYNVISRCSYLHIPNAFSPNGDGENDVFAFVGNAESFEATIFDRWGKPITHFSSIKDTWDGKNAPEGVYTYVFKTVCEDGKALKRAGTITLIR